jgi:serine/threonine-protein phosphatase PGAM5
MQPYFVLGYGRPSRAATRASTLQRGPPFSAPRHHMLLRIRHAGAARLLLLRPQRRTGSIAAAAAFAATVATTLGWASRAAACEPQGDAGEGDAGQQEGYAFNGFTPRKPTVPYPGWDVNWDSRNPPAVEKGAPKLRSGPSRHLILVRHGQYDESHKEDNLRILTPLGRQQAEATGRRLAELVAAGVRIKAVHVSDMARAQETAQIIKKHLPGVEATAPNPNLNEGRPAHVCPGGRPGKPRMSVKSVARDSPRIEAAFHTHFYRSDPLALAADAPAPAEKSAEAPAALGGTWAWEPGCAEASTGEEERVAQRHEYEVVVAHGNVIRYFVCRALQIPPEAWLRFSTFNCSLTYLTVRPSGSVSCRSIGDVGHLEADQITFSGHHGYSW